MPSNKVVKIGNLQVLFSEIAFLLIGDNYHGMTLILKSGQKIIWSANDCKTEERKLEEKLAVKSLQERFASL